MKAAKAMKARKAMKVGKAMKTAMKVMKAIVLVSAVMKRPAGLGAAAAASGVAGSSATVLPKVGKSRPASSSLLPPPQLPAKIMKGQVGNFAKKTRKEARKRREASESATRSNEASESPPRQRHAGSSRKSTTVASQWFSAAWDPRYYSEKIKEVKVGKLVEFVVVNEAGVEVGTALIEVVNRVSRDPEGECFSVLPIATEDPGMMSWLSQTFPSGSGSWSGATLLHLCRGAWAGCAHRGELRPVVHADRWRVRGLTDIIEPWMLQGLQGGGDPGPGGGPSSHGGGLGMGEVEPARGRSLLPRAEAGWRPPVPPPLAPPLEPPPAGVGAVIMPGMAGFGRGGTVTPPAMAPRAGPMGAVDRVGQHFRSANPPGERGRDPPPAGTPMLPPGFSGSSVGHPGAGGGLFRSTLDDLEGLLPGDESAGGLDSPAGPREFLKDKLVKKKAEVGAVLAARANRHSGVAAPVRARDARVGGGGGDERESEAQKGHKRRKKKQRSSSDSGSDSEGAQSLFRKASSSSRGVGSRFREMARSQPGRLMMEGFKTMRQHLDPKLAGGGNNGDPRGSSEGLDGCATAYTVNVVQGRGTQLSQRNERELRTLATGLDALAHGQLAEAGDIFMQRYKAVELAGLENNWNLAARLEVIPDAKPSSISTEERHAAATHELQELKLQKLMAGSRVDRRPYPKDGHAR